MTSEPENAERLQWSRAEIRWEGADDYWLDVPHFIDAWPAAWLHRNLDRRLRDANPEWMPLGATVTQATPARKPNSVGWSEPGYITVFGLWLPFDGADRLRHEIAAAVEDAYAAAKAAIEKADQILVELRGEA